MTKRLEFQPDSPDFYNPDCLCLKPFLVPVKVNKDRQINEKTSFFQRKEG